MSAGGDIPQLPTGSAALATALVGLGFMAASWFLVTRVLRPRLTRKVETPPLAYRASDLFLVIGIYLGAMILVGSIAGWLQGGGEPREFSPQTELSLAALVQVFSAIGLILLARALKASPAHFGLADRSPVVSFAWGGLMYLCCLPAIMGAGAAWTMALQGVGYKVQGQDVAQLVSHAQGTQRVVVFALSAVLIPFLEEFLFRGFLQNWLVKLRGPKVGILMTSLFFALLHGISPLGALWVVALAAGMMLQWTGSLWAAFGVHAVNNAVSTLLLFADPNLFPL